MSAPTRLCRTTLSRLRWDPRICDCLDGREAIRFGKCYIVREICYLIIPIAAFDRSLCASVSISKAPVCEASMPPGDRAFGAEAGKVPACGR